MTRLAPAPRLRHPLNTMRLFITLLAVLALLACDKSHDAAGSGSSPVTADDYPERLNDVRRQLDERCCQRTGLTLLQDGAYGEWPEPRATFDAKAAKQCLAELARMECPLAKGGIETYQPAICRKVYTGTLRVGDTCYSPWDCEPSHDPRSSISCPLALAHETSVCTRVSIGKEGEGCESWRSEKVICEPPLLCDPDEVCAKPATMGEICLTGPNYGDTCAQGLMCDRTGTKRCVKPTPVGKACDTIEDCESLGCVDGECREPLLALPLCGPE